MKSPLWLNMLWFASWIASCMLAWTILKLQLLKHWPSLFAACLQNIISSVLLASQLHHYKNYFYIFWINAGIEALIRITVLGDVVRAIPLSRSIPKGIQALFLILALSAGVTAWYMSQVPSTPKTILATVILLNRCVNASWAVAVIVLVACIFMTGLGWGITPIRIATGYAVTIGATVVTSYTFSFGTPALRLAMDGINIAIAGWAICYWTYSLRLARVSPAEEIKTLAEGLSTTI